MAATRNRMQQALAGNAPRGALVIDGGMGRNDLTAEQLLMLEAAEADKGRILPG